MLIAINTVKGGTLCLRVSPLRRNTRSPRPLSSPPGRPLPSAQTWDNGICFG